MDNPHILVIPYPAQGHVIPLMELSQRLLKRGFKITFANTDFNHQRVVNALRDTEYVGDQLHLVSIPDGMEPGDDRNDFGMLTETILRVMPGKLEQLIKDINGGSESSEITCVLADQPIGWALKVAEKLGIHRAAFWTASASSLLLKRSIHKLIDDGIIDNQGRLRGYAGDAPAYGLLFFRNFRGLQIGRKKKLIGTPMTTQMIQLSSNMPTMNPAKFTWASIGDLTTQKIMFKAMFESNKSLEAAEWLISNSTYDLEPAAFDLVPELRPIGPLLASNHSFGNFWSEDSTCLKWLDQQPFRSVIYVAFGSFTVFNQIQFQELALGLELSNKPFLWVVRPDIINGGNQTYPKGFQERTSTRGKMVGWAPQQKVLSHPSISCFMSHCGWNSTMEGVSNGVPFLCWPYFSDQFINETYICDVWKVGLKFDPDENGIISHGEFKKKLDQLLNDEDLRARSSKLKEMIVNNIIEGGLSSKTFNEFVEWLKA